MTMRTCGHSAYRMSCAQCAAEVSANLSADPFIQGQTMPGPTIARGESESRWLDIIQSGFGDTINDGFCPPGAWWISAARECIAAGHAQVITSRDRSTVYMLRCWLTSPQPSSLKDDKHESGNAVLLHWILQPDDVPHLHNHPWNFQTHVLAGGYVEERTRADFREMAPYDAIVEVEREPKDSATTTMEAYHRITRLLAGPGNPHTAQGGSWTLVTTGERRQRWSFLIDGANVDADDFLRSKRDAEKAQS